MKYLKNLNRAYCKNLNQNHNYPKISKNKKKKVKRKNIELLSNFILVFTMIQFNISIINKIKVISNQKL